MNSCDAFQKQPEGEMELQAIHSLTPFLLNVIPPTHTHTQPIKNQLLVIRVMWKRYTSNSEQWLQSEEVSVEVSKILATAVSLIVSKRKRMGIHSKVMNVDQTSWSPG